MIGTAFANPLPAPPILTIYIRSDGTIDPPNVPIQRTGNTYTFTNDIKNATIEIQRNNTILDGAVTAAITTATCLTIYYKKRHH